MDIFHDLLSIFLETAENIKFNLKKSVFNFKMHINIHL